MEKINENTFRDYIPFNKENINGRIYTKDSFKFQLVEKIQERIREGTLFGEIGMPEHIPYETSIPMENISHIVTSIGFYDNYLLMYIRFLENVSEHLISQIEEIKNNPEKFVVRPRSKGTVDPSTKIINIDTLIALDIIPAYVDAFKNILDYETISK